MGQTISTLNESGLHASLKEWAAGPGAQFEVEIGGYVVDVLQPTGELVEIQTANFGAIWAKLAALSSHYQLRLIYPIAQQKWIIRRAPDGTGYLGRRRSPVRGTIFHLFYELVRTPNLLAGENISLEVVLTEEEEYRRYGQTRRRRRWRWLADERVLLDVVERYHFRSPSDLLALLPPSLPDPFTTADLAAAINQKRPLAQKMVYCLRKLGQIDVAGKAGNALLYHRPTS